MANDATTDRASVAKETHRAPEHVRVGVWLGAADILRETQSRLGMPGRGQSGPPRAHSKNIEDEVGGMT